MSYNIFCFDRPLILNFDLEIVRVNCEVITPTHPINHYLL